MLSVTILALKGGKCDSKNLVTSGCKQICQLLAINMEPLLLKLFVASGNKELWRPLSANYLRRIWPGILWSHYQCIDMSKTD